MQRDNAGLNGHGPTSPMPAGESGAEAESERDVPRRARRMAECPVIGLGASAGGLEAYEEFFASAPADGGLAYVLVQHLDPNHESMLSDLIARRTSMPVAQITDGMRARPNHIYCIPPNATLSIASGRLHLSSFKEPRGLRRPIDGFFASLAQDQGENAACIVLSGTGGDGVQGLRAMKEAGGLTLAQDPATARYDGMPRSAAATGVVDHISNVRDMPGILIGYFSRRLSGAPISEAEMAQAHRSFLDAVCRELKGRTGHDFSAYKPSTLLRRIRRRMQVLGIDEETSYLGRLVAGDEEPEALMRDLLINVTEFFRDAEPFKILGERVIPEIVRGRDASDTVRVWVPGCSSGEEAYSIAMLLDAAAGEQEQRPQISVFATDIDEAMLTIARNAVYPQAIVKDLPPTFRDRYLIADEHGYVICAHIRDMVRFSTHNMIKDPPFSRLDLISCRNLLIYLGTELQKRVIPLFHYALNERGFLFLGTSENVGQSTDLFEPVDRRARIFRRVGGRRAAPLDLPLEPREQPSRPAPRAPLGGGREGELRDIKAVQLRVLDRYAPAHVVIDTGGHVVHTSGRTGKYLELASGAPSTNLFDLARTDLRKSLRRLVQLARDTGRRQIMRDVEVASEFGVQPIDLAVDPISDGRLLVVFQDVETFRQQGDEQAEVEVRPDADERGRVRELEEELRETQERLRSTIEELEISNEELKTSNEEMMSMNEELQSANEELSTVNEELKNKLDQLARANNDLGNFLESTQIAVIFLDTEMRLRRFTPASTRIFNFIDQDRGRPLADVSTRLDYDELAADARKVLATLVPSEREVQVRGGQGCYVARILPYRTLDNVIDGVVLTFTEISRLKKAEADLRLSERRTREQKDEIEALYRTAPIGMALVDRGQRFLRVNQVMADLGGTAIEEHVGHRLDAVAPKLGKELSPLVERVLRSGEAVHQMELGIAVEPGRRATFLVEAYPFGGSQEERAAVGLILQDVTANKRLTESQRQLMNELQHRVKNTLATVQSIIRQTARGKDDIDSFAEALNRRIAALARTHNLLTLSNWTDASLQSILEHEFAPYTVQDPGRVALRGEDVALPPRTALALTMAFHELTTNAAKHGALSNEKGGIEVRWELIERNDVRTLCIDWRESGGPAVDNAEERQGFGRLLLERGLAHDLQGSVSMHFHPTGLQCEIEAPLRPMSGM